MNLGQVRNSWQKLQPKPLRRQHTYVATATKRSPHFFEAQLDPSHGTGAWALQELCDDFFVLEWFEKECCKKEAVVLRLETALMAPDATPSLKYRGISYLRQNGFATTL